MMLPLKDIFSKYSIYPTGVLHIGASEGQERDFYEELKVKRVYWIEAIPDVFFKLKANLNTYPNQIAINSCVGDKDGEYVTFNISNNEAQSSSLLELGEHLNAHPEVGYVGKMTLRMNRVDRLFELLDLDTSMLDFLNMDLQGAELLALEGMGDMLDQFKSINIEVNKRETYIGCPLVEDIDYFLLKKGFERMETSVFVGDCWGDAFYIRTNI